jgi:cystathionine beta-lyase/cystathionine gamma-synthase
MIQKIFATELLNMGAIMSPNDAWLMLLSLRTLHIRLDRIKASTEKVVAFMESHPQVEKLMYPFSKSFPQFELAQKQMQWCGGLFTVFIKAKSVAQVELFCNSLERFLMAVSWGGHESLIIPACSFMERSDYEMLKYGYNAIRFYIGLENPEVLIGDLQNAFSKIE